MSTRMYVQGMRGNSTLSPQASLLMGAGNSTVQPETDVADKNFIDFYLKSSAATGTSRGMYLREYLSGGAGGEALRVFTTVSNAAPADTVNGAHISLNFGASAGNVTGEGNAIRATLHLANRSLTGTTAAVKAELWADGSSTVVGGTTAFLRASAGGTQAGIDSLDDSGFFMVVDGLTAGTGHLLRAAAPGTLAASLRCKVGATTYYLPLYSAPA